MHNRDWTDKGRDLGSAMVDTMAKMTDLSFRWPMAVTGAAMDAMVDSMRVVSDTIDRSERRVTTASSGAAVRGSTHRTHSSSGYTSPGEDLSGDDLKYVVWAIVFTKPHHETVLEPHRDEIVNYDTDAGTFAGVKIADLLDRARQGKIDRPQAWADHGSQPASASTRRSGTSAATSGDAGPRDGWRIAPEDHRYIKFLYRVDRRLPKEDVEVTRIEKVTVEHTTAGAATTT